MISELRIWIRCKEVAKHGLNRTSWYDEGVLEPLTQQRGKSIGGVFGFAEKQADTVRRSL